MIMKYDDIPQTDYYSLFPQVLITIYIDQYFLIFNVFFMLYDYLLLVFKFNNKTVLRIVPSKQLITSIMMYPINENIKEYNDAK